MKNGENQLARKTGIARLMEITMMRKAPVIIAAIFAVLSAIASMTNLQAAWTIIICCKSLIT